MIWKFSKKRGEELFKKEMGLMGATAVLIPKHKQAAALRAKATEIREELRKQMMYINEKRTEALELEAEAVRLESITLAEIPAEARVKRCYGDNCLGWLDASLFCEVCSQRFCESCHSVACGHHVCDDGQVEDVAYIESTTLPCPTCQTRITKIDGCDQMFCTACDTPFSWRSGAVETGIIHNPHYLRKMEADGYLPRFAVNDELPPWRDLADIVPRHCDSVRGFYALVYDLLKHQSKLFIPICTDNERAQYMMGKINKSKFCSLLRCKEKNWLLQRQIAKTTDVFLHVGSRLFWLLLGGHMTIGEMCEKIEKMRVEANAELLELSRFWETRSVPVYDEEFTVGQQRWRRSAVNDK